MADVTLPLELVTYAPSAVITMSTLPPTLQAHGRPTSPMELVTCAPTAVINPLFTLSSPPHCRHMADFATDLHMPLELVTCARLLPSLTPCSHFPPPHTAGTWSTSPLTCTCPWSWSRARLLLSSTPCSTCPAACATGPSVGTRSSRKCGRSECVWGVFFGNSLGRLIPSRCTVCPSDGIYI